MFGSRSLCAMGFEKSRNRGFENLFGIAAISAANTVCYSITKVFCSIENMGKMLDYYIIVWLKCKLVLNRAGITQNYHSLQCR